jgi:hypothetical protein
MIFNATATAAEPKLSPGEAYDIDRFRRDGIDERMLMEFGQSYARLNHPDVCQACTHPAIADFSKRLDLMTTLHHTTQAPLGRLYARCPEHQTKWENAGRPMAGTVEEKAPTFEVTLKLQVCTGCFQVRATNGSCGCE